MAKVNQVAPFGFHHAGYFRRHDVEPIPPLAGVGALAFHVPARRHHQLPAHRIQHGFPAADEVINAHGQVAHFKLARASQFRRQQGALDQGRAGFRNAQAFRPQGLIERAPTPPLPPPPYIRPRWSSAVARA